MIVFDTTALSFLFIPGYVPSIAVKFGKERLEELTKTIASSSDKLGIPTPAMSEFLITCDDTQMADFLNMIRTSPWIEILDFDPAAAIEVAVRTRKAIAAGDKNEGMTSERTKIKFDRQIVAIALTAKASKIVSDDKDVKNLGTRWGIEVVKVGDLPIPAALIPPPIIAMAMEAEEKSATKAEASKSEPAGANG